MAGYVGIGTAAFAAGATKILKVDATNADERTNVPTRLKAEILRIGNYISGVINGANASDALVQIEGITPRFLTIQKTEKYKS